MAPADPAVVEAARAIAPANADKPLDAAEFAAAYRKDRAASDSQHQGKVLLFNGKVLSISEVIGAKVVTVGKERGGYSLDCRLLDAQQAGGLAADLPIKIKGKVRGGEFFYDVIDDCFIVAN